MVYEQIASSLGISVMTATILITTISLWELVWKGFGLWNAARNKHKIWFIAILIINLVGLIPIIYLLIYKPWKKKAKK